MKGIVTKRFRAVREGSIHPVWIEPGTELDGELAEIARSIGALEPTLGVLTRSAAPPMLGEVDVGESIVPLGVVKAAGASSGIPVVTLTIESGNVVTTETTLAAAATVKPSRRARLLKKWVDEADPEKPSYAKGTFVDGEIAARAVDDRAAVFVATAASPETR